MTMNSQETMNMVKQILTMIFSALTVLAPGLATSQQYSLLTTSIITAVPALATAGSIIWSIYTHWNMKKVPDAATAIILPATVPGAPPPPPAPVGAVVNLTPMSGLAKVVGALLIGFLVLQTLPAMAQRVAQSERLNPLPLRKPAVTGNVIKDIKTDFGPATATPTGPATGDPLATFMAQLETITQDTISGVIADIQLADNDAATIIVPAIPATAAVPANPNATPPTPAIPAFPATPAVVKDPISHACYPAAIQFLSSIPAVAAPTGKFVGVQLFQAKRDFIAQLQAGLPTYLKLGCAPLLGDEINIAVQVFNMIGIKILPAALTAVMPALAPITLPAMVLAP
jgi:hypothetical protein